jgi:hypothetical protein
VNVSLLWRGKPMGIRVIAALLLFTNLALLGQEGIPVGETSVYVVTAARDAETWTLLNWRTNANLKFWKNDDKVEPFELPKYYKSGDDIYEAGEIKSATNKAIGVIKKNGKIIQYLSDAKNEVIVFDIFVSGSDVFAAGLEYGIMDCTIPTIWKNGKVLYRLGPSGSSTASAAYSVYVLNGDVYAGGVSWFIGGNMSAVVWKNGKALYRHSKEKFFSIKFDPMRRNPFDPTKRSPMYAQENIGFDMVHSVFVSGDDVYSAGKAKNEGGIYVPVVWKNQNVLYKFDAEEDMNSVALQVFVR